MKNRNLLLLAILYFTCLTSINAQSLNEKMGEEPSSTSEIDGVKKNIVKVNLLALSLKNFSFQYERVLNKHISVALGVRTMPSTSIPFRNSIKKNAEITDQKEIDLLDNVRVGNFAITPEIRFYLSKKGYGHGFYIAPYYRYAKFSTKDLPIEYSTDFSTTATLNLKGNIVTHNGGVMLGVQWTLAKAISLDWWIVGGHYGVSKGTLTGTTSQVFSPEEQADIKSMIDDIESPVGNVKSEVYENGAKVTVNGPWAGVRGGLTIGFRF